MILSTPMSSGDGEFDANPVMFGLDQPSNLPMLLGSGPEGVGWLLGGLTAASDAALDERSVGVYGTLHHAADVGATSSSSSDGDSLHQKSNHSHTDTAHNRPGYAANAWVKQTVEKGWSLLPTSIDLVGLDDRASSLLALPRGPLVMLCQSECTRFNLLLQTVRADLAALRAVLLGNLGTNSLL